ncbi:MAG: hypothetical protein DMD91_00510, partial [Candidatus Rokuibacteriota bacterium]
MPTSGERTDLRARAKSFELTAKVMQKFRHPVLALLVLATLWPTVAWGQPEKVGVVATLEGSVTARRAILPQPVALKFKDDVFARDTLTTGDQSLARVLLGGKSIVTIR